VWVTCEVKGDEGTSHGGISPEEEVREPHVPLHHKRFFKLGIHSYSRRVKNLDFRDSPGVMSSFPLKKKVFGSS